jgi:hypothetical protein
MPNEGNASENFKEELDRREYWGPHNVGSGKRSVGATGQIGSVVSATPAAFPIHHADSSTFASPTSSTPLKTKS